MICPEQDWLPRRVIIEDGGELQAEWSISDVATTDTGLIYPVEFKVRRPESDDTPLLKVTINSFRERSDFSPKDFVISPSIGIDIVDNRAGFAWHNDPWWDELSAWQRDNLQWPRTNLAALKDLRSHSDSQLAGMPAPQLNPGEALSPPAIRS